MTPSKEPIIKISPITLLALIVAFVWLGYAYTLGVDSKSMFTNPIVPMLLLTLVVSLRNVESSKTAIVITVILIATWLFIRLKNVFMPFIIGMVLAYIVHVCLDGLQSFSLPWIRRLQSEMYETGNPSWLKKIFRFLKSIRFYMHPIRLSRSSAALLLILIILGGIALMFFTAVPQIVKQSINMKNGIVQFYMNILEPYAKRLYQDFQNEEYPSFIDRLPTSLKSGIKDALAKANTYISERIPSLANATGQIITKLFTSLYTGLVNTIGQISSIFFIIIIFIYAVQGFYKRLETYRNILPDKYQDYITRYAVEIDTNMRSFLRGQLTVIISVSALSIIVYSIIGVPFAFIVGILAGICNLIPNFGPILGGIIALLALIVGLAAGQYSFTPFLIRVALTIGGVLGIQFIDNSLISPRVMSKAVEVEPLMVMFFVLLFASLVGIWGALLAIPAIVIIKAVVKVLREIQLEQQEKG